MALRLTKTSKIIFAISIVVLLGALGYLVWRVNQPETVAPTESEAGGGAGACCTPSVGCVAGYECKDIACSDTESPQTYYYGDVCPSTQTSTKCRTGFECQGSTCVPINMWTCVALDEGEEPTEGDCKDVRCEWPEVLMSGRIDPNEDVCRCEVCTGKDANDPYSCNGNPPSCNPAGCPSGYESCGTSENHEDSNDCEKRDSIRCVAYHPDCNNPTYVFRYCKPIAAQTNVCDGGSWVNKPSGNVNFDKDIVFSATATDSNGIKGDSITAKLCTGSLAVCTTGEAVTYTISNTTPTSTTFGGILNTLSTRLTPGTYTISLAWADALGITGAGCALTSTFTVLPEETNPNWNISKSVVEKCIDEDTPNPKLELTYTITVTNNGDSTGYISKIEDDLDDKVLSAFIQPGITTPGTYANGIISWQYSGGFEVGVNASKVYTYKLNIEKDNFGLYNNIVTLYPQDGESLRANASINADCEITEEEIPQESIPQTGLFDNTLGRVFFGIILVIVGIIIYSIPNGIFMIDRKEDIYKHRERFEKRIRIK